MVKMGLRVHKGGWKFGKEKWEEFGGNRSGDIEGEMRKRKGSVGEELEALDFYNVLRGKQEAWLDG